MGHLSGSTPAFLGQQGVGQQLLTAAEVAAYLKISPKKVYGLGIPEVRLSDRRVRYRPEDLEAFILQNRRAAK